jgi:hypothetical protein
LGPEVAPNCRFANAHALEGLMGQATSLLLLC